MPLKLLNRGFLIIALLFSYEVINAQERFNVRNPIEFQAVSFSGVTELDNGYAITCKGVTQGDEGSDSPFAFARFTLDGTYVDKKMYFRDEGFSIIITLGGLNYINDEFQFVSIGQEQFTDINDGFLVRFDEQGDTLEYREFRSPYYEEFESEFMAPVAICNSTNEDNSIFISSNIFHPDSGTGGDFYIQRIAPDGEVLWEYIYATSAQPEYSNALLPTENGGVLSMVFLWGDFDYLLELDSLGDVVTNTVTTIYNDVNGLEWVDNEEFIGAGNGLGTDNFITGRFFRMNRQGDVIWDTILGDGYAQSFQNQFYALVKSQDNSGYVAGGTKKEFIPEAEQTDSTGTTISQGWLVKVDEDGAVIWDRNYHYINTPNEEHTLNDLKATSDGGYIFCGESRDLDSDQEFSEGPPQQGWLVKVDEYGCLVEGCHLSDDISVLEQDAQLEYFKAGPNPAKDFLNIYQSHNAPIGSVYQLIDMNGRVLEEFPAHSKGSTMMLSVEQFSVGGYQLVLKTKKQLLQSARIIIE